MPTAGVAASCMATDAITALSQVATECTRLLDHVCAAVAVASALNSVVLRYWKPSRRSVGQQ